VKLARLSQVYFGDSVRTGPGARVEIAFDDSSSVALADTTTAHFSESSGDNDTREITVFNAGGEIMSDLRGLEGKGVSYVVKTPTAVVNPHGTQFVVYYDTDPMATDVRVLHGTVYVVNVELPEEEPVVLVDGYSTSVVVHAPPVVPVVMNYGQFKKMRRTIGPRRYKHFEDEFRVGVHVSVSAPLFVPVVPPGLMMRRHPGRGRGGPPGVPVPVPGIPGRKLHRRGPRGPAVVPVPVPGVPVPGVPGARRIAPARRPGAVRGPVPPVPGIRPRAGGRTVKVQKGGPRGEKKQKVRAKGGKGRGR